MIISLKFQQKSPLPASTIIYPHTYTRLPMESGRILPILYFILFFFKSPPPFTYVPSIFHCSGAFFLMLASFIVRASCIWDTYFSYGTRMVAQAWTNFAHIFFTPPLSQFWTLWPSLSGFICCTIRAWYHTRTIKIHTD